MTIGRDRPLRVLGFCDYFSGANGGGAERVALETYRRLAERGVDVTVLTVDPHAGDGHRDVDGVRVASCGGRDLTRRIGAQMTLAPSVFRAAHQLVLQTRPDVLHVHGLHFQSGLAGALASRRSPAPLVTTVHVADMGTLPAVARTAAAAYERTAGRFILRRSRRVIAVSGSVASHVLRRGAAPGSVSVIPNGVDHAVFRPTRGQTEDGRPFTMMFVGRLVANKGPDVFIDACRELVANGVRVRALVVGDGPLRRTLEAAVRSMGLARIVTFTGHVDDVARLLGEADVLVRPSLTEGMPLAVLEAMAAGVCVVATAVPGNTDLIEDGVNGLLFRAGDARDLAARVLRLVDRPDMRSRLARTASERVATYTWARTADETHAVLSAAAETANALCAASA
jgi:glycosyltransferase involved in cell wall biosynthesis